MEIPGIGTERELAKLILGQHSEIIRLSERLSRVSGRRGLSAGGISAGGDRAARITVVNGSDNYDCIEVDAAGTDISGLTHAGINNIAVSAATFAVDDIVPLYYKNGFFFFATRRKGILFQAYVDDVLIGSTKVPAGLYEKAFTSLRYTYSKASLQASNISPGDSVTGLVSNIVDSNGELDVNFDVSGGATSNLTRTTNGTTTDKIKRTDLGEADLEWATSPLELTWTHTVSRSDLANTSDSRLLLYFKEPPLKFISVLFVLGFGSGEDFFRIILPSWDYDLGAHDTEAIDVLYGYDNLSLSKNIKVVIIGGEDVT